MKMNCRTVISLLLHIWPEKKRQTCLQLKVSNLLPMRTTAQQSKLLKGLPKTTHTTYIGSQNDSSVEFKSSFVLLVNLLLAFSAHFAFRLYTGEMRTGELGESRLIRRTQQLTFSYNSQLTEL